MPSYDYSVPVAVVAPGWAATLSPMNSTLLPPARLPGFKVVPKRHLGERFRPSQSAFYVLLGRRGAPTAPRERVLFVHYLNHFLGACQRQIDALWEKHRVLITHVAVKVARRVRRTPGEFAELYQRAVEVQHLREKLHPRFRRL
jgi:hypothetical protein